MNTELSLQSLGFFALRAPYLPVETWLDYRSNASDGWAARAAAARALLADPIVDEALFLASRSFHARLGAADWRMDTEGGRKLLLAFERYLNRMCMRSTPFGLFSTVAPGKVTPLVSPRAARTFAAGGTTVRKVRVNVDFLQVLRDQTVAQHAPQMRYLSNRSVYTHGARIKYVECRLTPRGSRNYVLSEVDAHPLVMLLLALCEERALPIDTLQERAAARHPKTSEATVYALIDDMIAAGLLLPSLAVDLLSMDPARELGERMLGIPSCADVGAELLAINAAAAQMNDVTNNIVDHYERLDARLSALCTAPADMPRLRVDGFRLDQQLMLDQAYTETFLDDMSLLISRFNGQDARLDFFASQFEQRYGNSMVPLTELLEDENLFGAREDMYAHDLLRRTGVLGADLTAASGDIGPLQPFDQFLINKLLQAREGGPCAPLRITRDEVRALPTRGENFPDTMFAILTVLSEQSVDAGQVGKCHTWLQGMSSSSAGAWLGRFCYAMPEVDEGLRRTASDIQERDQDVIHAEISYLPAGALGNILNRPLIWSHRINLVEGVEADATGEIALSDILVKVSGREVQIWSAKLGKRIMPHMTSAFNNRHLGNIHAYVFLSDVELHHKHSAHFGWSKIFTRYEYLPRIEYAGIILAPARWLIERAGPVLDRGAFRSLLDERGVPAHVELKQYDSTLIVDWSDEIEFEQLYRLYKKEPRLVLREVIGARGTDTLSGLVRHEVILPFSIAPRPIKKTAVPNPSSLPTLRDLPPVPAAEVVYVKIFMPSADVDGFLLDVCAPVIADLRQRFLMHNWFYIRYDELGHHIRLRIFVRDADAGAAVSKELVARLDRMQQQKSLRNFVFARYEREVVRYGGPELMALSEQLFAFDSDIALATLGAVDTDEQRWHLALWSCNALLEDAGLSLEACHQIASKMAAKFGSEFRVGRNQQQLLSKEFRRHSVQMLAMVAREGAQPPWAQAFETASLAQRQARRALIAAQRGSWSRAVAEQFEATLGSHLHMTCNRLFKTHARAYEVLVYDTLERSYRALLGRNRQSLRLAA